MLTEFGKFTRKLRIDNNELLYDMAKKLEVSPSYLSAVETGKRDVPEDWYGKIIKMYNVNLTVQGRTLTHIQSHDGTTPITGVEQWKTK